MQYAYLRLTKGPEFNVEQVYKDVEHTIAHRRALAKTDYEGAPTGAEIAPAQRKYATEAVSEAKQKFGIDLDYSEEALHRLEGALLAVTKLLADEVSPEQRVPEADKKSLRAMSTLRYGAYLGEMFCRHFGGEWRDNLPGLNPKLIRVVIGELILQPGEMVFQCIGEPAKWSVRTYYLDTKRAVETERALAKATSFNEKMGVCAQEAVMIARDHYDITLDFSEASIANLERLLASMHAFRSTAGNEKTFSEEQLKSRAITFGAYLGEVFRRNLGGDWLKENPSAPGSLPALNVSANILTPCRKVLKRILEGPGESVEFFYKSACKIIRKQQSQANYPRTNVN